MLRYLKIIKPVKLGRWKTNQPHADRFKIVDFANCDSCGTCRVLEHQEKEHFFYCIDGDLIRLKKVQYD